MLSLTQMMVDNLSHRPSHQEGGQLAHRPAHQPLAHRPSHQPHLQETQEEEEETEKMTTFEKFNHELNNSAS